MRHLLKKLLPSVAVALTVTGSSLPIPARAQTYPIDCAILLCLSGGWPASVPCARARAEFIRRITPWPVEPPLQIWRCPMGASLETAPAADSADRIFEVFFQNNSTGLVMARIMSDVQRLQRVSTHVLADLVRVGVAIPLVAAVLMAVHFWRIRKDGGISGPL